MPLLTTAQPCRAACRDYVGVFWEFIPHIIFLNALFGYLSIIIIVKWVTTGETEQFADLYK